MYSNVDGFAVQLKNHIEDALDQLQIEWKECHIDEVTQASEAFTPTMHIFFHPNKSIYSKIDEIKNLKGHKLLWDMESPYESDIVFDMAPHFYYIFTSDLNTAEQLQKEFPQNHIQYVPHACNPLVHKKQEVDYKYRSDVCFVGNAYPSRIKYFSENAIKFMDKMVTIIGVGYRGLDGFSSQRVIHGHVSEAEMIKYYCGAKIALNLHRQLGDLDMANSRNIKPKHLNNRFYELAAMGVPQLVEGRDDLMDQINEVSKQDPQSYSYKARLTKFYLPLLSK